jgi:hypothetical protein
MKITLVGGGGFRTPLTWESLAGLADLLVLYDISADRLSRMETVIEGMRSEREGPAIQTATDLEVATDGADFIFCAIRVGGLKGRVTDEKVPLRVGVLGQETIGPGGICWVSSQHRCGAVLADSLGDGTQEPERPFFATSTAKCAALVAEMQFRCSRIDKGAGLDGPAASVGERS